MLTRRKFLATLGGVGGLAVAGGLVSALLPGKQFTSGDPSIRYGEERCAQCGMVIGDERFAAAWRGPGLQEEHFDDVGCMLAAFRDRNLPATTPLFVHDYESLAWVDGANAVFVVAEAIRTPMAYGVAAFAQPEAARAAAGEQKGRVADWTNLRQTLERKG